MKLIHTGDVHLDAALDHIYPPAEAKIRRQELRENFLRLFPYARENGVTAILVAGDLFDTPKPLQKTKEALRDTLLRYPEIGFFYLRGNHDPRILLSEMPENFHIFGDEIVCYPLGENVMLYGAEKMEESDYDRLFPDPYAVNLMLLHGAVSENSYGTDTVNLRGLRRKNLEYLALGHYHTHKKEALDERGTYAYCGCLSGRGFDECGEKGFQLLTVENRRVTAVFVPFADRQIHELMPEFPAGIRENDAFAQVEKMLSVYPQKDVVRLCLSREGPLSRSLGEQLVHGRFFYGEVVFTGASAAKSAVAYQDDVSLRGEFVRLVMGSRLSEEEKQDILTYGLAALRGEEAEDL